VCLFVALTLVHRRPAAARRTAAAGLRRPGGPGGAVARTGRRGVTERRLHRLVWLLVLAAFLIGCAILLFG
jgi:hypothetical protein